MNPFAIYLVEVSICLALFYFVYVLFKADTFHFLKRFYLVLTVVLSIIIPHLALPNLPVNIEQIITVQPAAELGEFSYHDTFEKVVFGQVSKDLYSDDQRTIPSIFTLIGIFYLAGVAYFLFNFLKNIFRIYSLYLHNRKERYLNYTIVHLSNEYPTFSFLNFIFLNSKNLIAKTKDDVILHEIIHARQKHSLDIIFFEICRIFFWFNPIMHLYKSSIVRVHECLADQFFIENRPENIIDYQSLLLKQYLSEIHIELAHPFNYALIKYRIKMMTKSKSKWWAKYKPLFALPIIAFGLVAFSNFEMAPGNGQNKEQEYKEPFPWGMIYVPPGSFTLQRSDGSISKSFDVNIDAFWMRETEVKVDEYNEYLISIKSDSTEQIYSAALPNSEKIPYADYYSEKKYTNFPAVGISLMQARNYCKWLTRKENQKLDKKGRPHVTEYRIPDEVEWIYASFGGVDPNEFVKPVVPGLNEIKKGKVIIKDMNNLGLIFMNCNVSEWTNTYFDPDVYMNELQKYPNENLVDSPDRIVVRGENYKKELTNDKLILNGNDAYDYVGFRYVRTYMGEQYKSP